MKRSLLLPLLALMLSGSLVVKAQTNSNTSKEPINIKIVAASKNLALAEPSTIIGNGGNGTKVILRGTNIPGKNPVYVVNGEIVTESNLLLIEPNKIQTVEILKNASAVALYGPEATNGVIIVTTKKDSSQKTKN